MPFIRNSVYFIVLYACLAPAYGQIVDKVVAKVNNEVVLLSDIEVQYQSIVRSEGYKEPNSTKCQILQQVLLDKVLLAKAKIDSVEVEDAQIEAELDRRMQYFILQFGSEETLEQTYGLTISELKAEFRDQIREQLTSQTMRRTVLSNAKVTPSEVRKYFRSLPKDSIPYFPSEVEVGQIVIKPKASEVEVAKARAQLLQFKAQIEQDGASFESLAKRHSQDYGSARKGGDLGWQGRGQLVPEFEEVALKIDEGEIADPIQSEFGMHLIQLIERRGNKFHARHILIKPNSGEEQLKDAEVRLDSLRKLIDLDSISFESIARDHSDDRATRYNAGYFTDPQSGRLKIPTTNLDPVVFFMIDTMQIGSISPPVRYRLQDGSEAVRVVYYKNKVDSHYADLKSDYQRIYETTLATKRGELMHDWMHLSLQELFIKIDPDYDYCQIMERMELF